MATNFEFYKDEIIKWIGIGSCAGHLLATCKGVPMKEICKDRSCKECFEVAATFLQEEHIEQPKLTKMERAFCEAVQAGWIARDCNMHLFYFSGKPELKQGTWMTRVGQHCRIEGIEDAFMFIKDTDSEPWSIEDLLKLDVMEEVQEDDSEHTKGD